MEANQKVCPKCGAHHKLTCKERFETFFDNKEYTLIKTPLPLDDPLNRKPNISKAKKILKWKPYFNFNNMVHDMVESDLKNLKKT